MRDVANKVSAYHPSLTISLLISSNHPTALQPLEVVTIQSKGPFAEHYHHGWTVNGSSDCRVFSEISSMKACVTPSQEFKMFEIDFCEKDKGCIPDECGNSHEDRKFIEMAERDIKFMDGLFEVALPFRQSKVSIPNNHFQTITVS